MLYPDDWRARASGFLRKGTDILKQLVCLKNRRAFGKHCLLHVNDKQRGAAWTA